LETAGQQMLLWVNIESNRLIKMKRKKKKKETVYNDKTLQTIIIIKCCAHAGHFSTFGRVFTKKRSGSNDPHFIFIVLSN
jgi:hypothetical protein